MKYLKRFLLGLGFLVGLNLLVVLVIWIQALIAVHEAREANADPVMPVEHHAVMTFPDFKHRSGGAGFWLDNDHLLIDGNMDGQVFGPTDLYVIDARDGSKTLFHKNAFLMYQNEDGSLHLALTDRDSKQIWHVDVVNDNFVAKEIDKPYPDKQWSGKYVFQSVGGKLFYYSDSLFFEKNGHFFDTKIKESDVPYGVDFDYFKKSIIIGARNTNAAKKTEGFYRIYENGSVSFEKFSPLIKIYKVNKFAVSFSKYKPMYYFFDNNGISNNNGVFHEDKDGKKFVKIWGKEYDERNVEDVKVSGDGCRISVGFKGREFDPNKSGFEIIDICN